MTHDIKTINTFDGRELILVTFPINGHAPGNYECHCHKCNDMFQGDKRAVTCEKCAIEMMQGTYLGTLTGHYIPDFDVEPFVEKGYSYHEVPHEVWHLDHKNPTLNDSFQSLLNANDVFMHNVKGEKKPVVMFGTMEDSETVNERVSKALTDWQTHQDKVVTKYIVLEKIK